jgi:DNA-binding response OmpR family regulator
MDTILVIEDESLIRLSITEILELHEFEVISCDNGKDGIENYYEFKPDLIICDIMMPVIDGFMVLKQLMDDPSFNTPFIFLSAKVQTIDVRTGMNLGADDFIHKPFKIEELLTAVERRISKHKKNLIENTSQVQNLQNLVKLMVGHEFLTPMNKIVFLSDFVGKNIDQFSKEEIADFCQNLDISVKRLQTTFDKIRKLYSLQEASANQNSLSEGFSAVFNIIQIAEGIAKNFQRENDLIFEKIDEANIKINKNYFCTLLLEVIENAFKFSERGEKVIIITEILQEEYKICIKDTGNKIKAKLLNSYKEFQQFNRKQNEQQGLGAGLAIAKQVVHLFQGKMIISDNLPNGIMISLYFKV